MFGPSASQRFLHDVQVEGVWPGKSGRKYSYISCDPDGPFISVGAVYIFVAQSTILGGPRPLYVGRTDDMGRRIDEHRRDAKWLNAKSMGMSAIHVIFLRYEADREVVERDLIAALNPPLNEVAPATMLGPGTRYLTGRL